MIRHVFTLMWNRKRHNALLLVELVCAFLVVVTLSVLAVQIVNNARQPIGFDYERRWSVRLSRGGNGPADVRDPASARATYQQLAAAVRELPPVEAASLTWTGPYESYNWDQILRLQDGRQIRHGANRADDRFADVVGLTVIAGRWFSREDEGSEWEPVVLTSRLAREVFGGENAIGRVLPERYDPAQLAPAAPPIRAKRVVGVVEEFRQFGELSAPVPYLFFRQALDDPRVTFQLPELLVLRVRPGTTAAFEETLVRRLEAVAPGWSFAVTPMEANRASMRRGYLIPIFTLGTVALALLLMAALGLTGVVWQNVTQRTREFGLRRANGATGWRIVQQVLGELLALTSAAVLVGGLLVIQIVFLPLPPDLAVVPRGVIITGVGLAAATLYLVTLLSGWYPARLATRVPPAEALHYE